MDLADLGELRPTALAADAQSARRTLAVELSNALMKAGQQLHVVGFFVGPGRVEGTSPFGNGDDGLVELGYVSQATSELVRGAAAALTDQNPYSAAALIRQLVEMEYLVWSFSERQQTWGDWLRSSKPERLKSWQPAHLRKASQGRFNDAEYGLHCELGGHPTPLGIRALIGTAAVSDVLAEILWSEICQHGERIWKGILAGSLAHQTLLKDMPESVENALKDWHTHDTLRADLFRIK